MQRSIFDDGLPGSPQTGVVGSEVLRLTRAEPTLDFREVFSGQFEYVWNALRRLGVPERDLEDLTHDVFLQVYRHFSDFDRSRPIKPWLFGFAFRRALDYRRLARHRLEVLDAISEARDSTPNALDRLEYDEELRLARAALERLDLERRALLILHDVEGCPVPEVARNLGIPPNTIYSRLRVAREQFQLALHRLRAQRGVR